VKDHNKTTFYVGQVAKYHFNFSFIPSQPHITIAHRVTASFALLMLLAWLEPHQQ